MRPAVGERIFERLTSIAAVKLTAVKLAALKLAGRRPPLGYPRAVLTTQKRLPSGSAMTTKSAPSG